MSQTKKISRDRIWELDAFRGLFILCVVVIHFIFDLETFKEMSLPLPNIYYFIQSNGGILFILISGICVTLGSHSLKRGIIVFLFGMLITATTYFVIPEEMIYFGILHLLGFCMILYPVYKKAPTWLITIVSVCIILLGYYFEKIYINNPYLFAIGLETSTFSSGDFFPIFPNLGYFMVGVILGRTVYADRKSLLPKIANNPVIRFFCFCGRNSLWIYLIHQPVLYFLVVKVL